MTLTETLTAEPPPLTLRDGVLFVTGTRVPIDTIIRAYQRGDTPKVISENFDSVRLVDVFAVLTYYHRHTAEVEAYLEEGRKRSEEVRRENEARWPSEGLKEKLLARKREMQK